MYVCVCVYAYVCNICVCVSLLSAHIGAWRPESNLWWSQSVRLWDVSAPCSRSCPDLWWRGGIQCCVCIYWYIFRYIWIVTLTSRVPVSYWAEAEALWIEWFNVSAFWNVPFLPCCDLWNIRVLLDLCRSFIDSSEKKKIAHGHSEHAENHAYSTYCTSCTNYWRELWIWHWHLIHTSRDASLWSWWWNISGCMHQLC